MTNGAIHDARTRRSSSARPPTLEDPRGPHYGRGPKGYRRSDERVREDVCDRIAVEGFIDASDVDVVVEDGIVTLRGSVAVKAHKRALEEILFEVLGVDEIHNDLRVRRESVLGGGGGARLARGRRLDPDGEP